MADDTPAQLEFLQFHLPSLTPGTYSVEVQQTLTGPGIGGSTGNTFGAALSFTVAGERLLLPPTDIQAVFPPEGSLLDHNNVLPHLVLGRSTAPWERHADPADPESPWLALVLLEEGENFATQTYPLDKLPGVLPGFVAEPGEAADAQATVLTLNDGLAQTLLPATTAELKLLTHVRRGKDEKGVLGEELAVVIGSRLPAKGVRSTVHLVALEGRYPGGQFDAGSGQVALLSLKSWSFSCLRRFMLTSKAISELQATVPAADLALLQPLLDTEVTGQEAFLTQVGQLLGHEVPASYRADLLKYAEQSKTFRELVHALQPGTLRLPGRGVAENLLGAGFLPLAHQFRDGQQLVSWYHGPLIPATSTAADAPQPVRAADALLRYHPSTGLLDVSYAAAWELGRLLGLSSKAFSVALYNWKRSVAQQQLVLQNEPLHAAPLLLTAAPATAPPPVPPVVSKWFADISLLVDLPFGYLVPDESLLPVESLRFFQVDALWMDALLDGAASLGRIIGQDVQHEQALNADFRFPYREKGLSGVLIRSEIVAGWPDLVVLGHAGNDASTPQQPLRRALLSKNVLLCLFEGPLQTLDVQLKPETMHFGLDDSTTHEGAYSKLLRGPKGSTTGQPTVDPVPWRAEDHRVLDISNLANQIQQLQTRTTAPDSAWFALEMIEGSVKARFHRTI
ncbi:hypothetical protein EJV47_11780 [Hymenobacter gummosus]|uniref:Uncharacterized protein n=1 Tax=Hymenobacter gummosus TaxID=1776032 RepID=A0A3S0IP91_9BACT|nr:hypothetical protein [Hymenobacter gummosus]RTQ50297.1 hypothetical protein EJV47_11780 [Hymenobacter gummosus]